MNYCLNCDGIRDHPTAECPHPDAFRKWRRSLLRPRQLVGDVRAWYRMKRRRGGWAPWMR